MKTPASLALAAFVVMSCARTSDVGTTRLTSSRFVPTDAAASRLTEARCEREVACKRIGPGGDFADRDHCMRDIGRDSAYRLRGDLCPEGIDDRKLSTCLAEVSNKRCSNPLDDLDEVGSCSRTELCIVRVIPARETTSPF